MTPINNKTDEDWFKIMRRCANITCKAACGTGYKQATGREWPMERFHEWEKLDGYKKSVEDFLLNKLHYSTEVVQELMKEYLEDFPEFLEKGWDEATVVAAMNAGY